jgi:hypothetical protein
LAPALDGVLLGAKGRENETCMTIERGGQQVHCPAARCLQPVIQAEIPCETDDASAIASARVGVDFVDETSISLMRVSGNCCTTSDE